MKNRHYFPVAIECGLISPAPRVEASMEDIKSKFHLRDSLLAFCMGVRAGLTGASEIARAMAAHVGLARDGGPI